MSETPSRPPLARRSFLSRFGAGAAAFGAAFAAPAGTAAAQTAAPAPPWQPARHEVDDWFDRAGTKHRLFLDTTTAAALGHAIVFTNNYMNASRNGYGLTDSDLAVVICVRHESTPFAFNDAMWKKYGAALGGHAAAFTDPKTKQPPTLNVYQATGYGTDLTNRNTSIDTLLQRGVRLAVCQLATRAISGVISRSMNITVDDAFKELSSNLITNGHIVPAGIVAVNRAQEHGYSFGYVGA